MADPQRRSRGSGVDRGAEGRGREGGGDVYERENEEREGGDEGRGEVAIGVRELGMVGNGDLGSGMGLEGGGDVGDEKRMGAKVTGECDGSKGEGVDAAASFDPGSLSAQEVDVHTAPSSRGSSPPVIRTATPESDNPSTMVSSHDAEQGVASEGCYSNTLDQRRRQRVRFDEALRMHSFGGSQYAGRVVDRDV